MTRAERCRDELQTTMEGVGATKGVVFTADSIDLSEPHVGLGCSMEMVKLTNRMIMKLGEKTANHS